MLAAKALQPLTHSQDVNIVRRLWESASNNPIVCGYTIKTHCVSPGVSIEEPGKKNIDNQQAALRLVGGKLGKNAHKRA
jgi:hypothetical protein